MAGDEKERLDIVDKVIEQSKELLKDRGFIVWVDGVMVSNLDHSDLLEGLHNAIIAVKKRVSGN